MSSQLADDILASLLEARDHAAGKKTAAIIHRVERREADTNDASMKPKHSRKTSTE